MAAEFIRLAGNGQPGEASSWFAIGSIGVQCVDHGVALRGHRGGNDLVCWAVIQWLNSLLLADSPLVRRQESSGPDRYCMAGDPRLDAISINAASSAFSPCVSSPRAPRARAAICVGG